ncbi:MAG: hypothetical protein H7A25_15225 [Leptospiraceae bacterium]|nr:hypothetical protein [Leptospiraceae bacterium]MCP5501251.1 hypothetical protein [Leptospiraceae bacterium]
MLKLWFLLVATGLSFCSTADKKVSLEDLNQKYQAAILDAKDAEASEISDKLIAIKKENKSLQWKNNRVLTLTWTNWDGYDTQIGKEMELSRETWVTTVPELKEFCNQQKPKNVSLRLEQLLGLPANNGKTKFIEMYVRAEDLFRPSADPEVNDSKAELDFPKGVSAEHKKWIQNLKESSYGEKGYPWTRLGYTYDWGNPKTEMGLSEFVIKKGSKVEIASVAKTEDYCK